MMFELNIHDEIDALILQLIRVGAALPHPSRNRCKVCWRILSRKRERVNHIEYTKSGTSLCPHCHKAYCIGVIESKLYKKEQTSDDATLP